METERLQRYKERCGYSENLEEALEDDKTLSERIRLLLNDDRITPYCVVDAYYYDFSGIPRKIQEELNLWSDVYFIFGISSEGEIVSNWVDRYDLDSSDPIVNGVVIKSEIERGNGSLTYIPPEIIQQFSKDLLSTPVPEFFRDF